MSHIVPLNTIKTVCGGAMPFFGSESLKPPRKR